MAADSAEVVLANVKGLLATTEWNADLQQELFIFLESAGHAVPEIPAGHRITVEIDGFYQPDGDYDVDVERLRLMCGELTAYTVLLEKGCECGNWNVIASLSGVVVETGNADNTYDRLLEIPDEYLRAVAYDLLMEAEAS